MIKHLSDKAEENPDLGEFVCDVIKMSGYDAYLNTLGDEGLTRADNVQELVVYLGNRDQSKINTQPFKRK